MRSVPVVDLRSAGAAAEIDAACREHGFFSVTGHGIDEGLLDDLVTSARAFFARPDAEKAAIAMRHGGRAWRGWFPVGGELTSGVPDRKEGLYLGEELAPGDPRVVAGLPLHGPNLFPDEPASLRPAVLAALDAFTVLGQRVMALVAEGLGLDAGHFAEGLTAEPTILFRIFHYPPRDGSHESTAESHWGVAEHTDYGLLTLLLQDDTGGLQVKAPGGWIDVPPQPGALVCNIGDMLERLTGGRYRSTPHRVRSPEAVDRISCPFFFDPGWDAEIEPLPLDEPAPGDEVERWDGARLEDVSGTYGDYLTAKVAKVFPQLFDEVL